MKKRAGAFAVVVTTGMVIVTFGSAAPPSPTPVPIQTKTCGEGVCKRTVGLAMVCKPGDPVTENDGWLYKVDATTNSWDANCDGTIEKKPIPVMGGQDYSLAGCEFTRGFNCAPKKMTDAPCGENWSVFSKCIPKIVDGKTKCVTGNLIGTVTQACR